jgi:transcriptional regulator NrdR family protein
VADAWQFGIRCPYCGSAQTKVIDSRKIMGGVRRRRECIDCTERHSTVEVIQQYLRHQKFTPAQIKNKTRAIEKYQKRKKLALDDAPSPG